MGQCLKTTLKESVNNDSLFYLGAITLKASATTSFVAANRNIQFASKSNGTLKIEVISEDGFFADNTGQPLYGNASYPGMSSDSRTFNYVYNRDATAFHLSNDDVEIRISSKYNLQSLRLGSEIEYDLGSMAYAAINAFYFSFTSLRGNMKSDISALKYQLLDIFNINSSNKELYGDVSELRLTKSASGTIFKVNGSSCKGVLHIREDRRGAINIQDTKIVINIADMPSTLLESINATRSGINGDCATLLSKMDKTKATLVALRGTACTGTIESMAEQLYGVTRGTQSPLEIDQSGSMTFNSAPVSGLLVNVSISGGNVVVKDENGTTIGTYNGSTWTYSS